MRDVIVVGSGAAGVGAALGLAEQGVKPLVLDVGIRPRADGPRAETDLYTFREQHDSFELTIGRELQGLSNQLASNPVPVKLTTPNSEYVTQHAKDIAPIDQEGFDAIQSFAAGGLANAWGAGLYRFTDADLDGFPLRAHELDPYFDKLTAEIGISGTDDDLTEYFGSTRHLLPPLRLSHNMGRLYNAYEHKRHLIGRDFRVGHPRVAVLSREHGDRPPTAYDNLEFWQESRAIYTPRYTLDRLIDSGKIDYEAGVLVDAWRETKDGVTVTATRVEDGATVTFVAKKLLLAAGAINTSKIVLRSFEDTTTRLSLLENPAIQIPFVRLAALGRRLDTEAFGLVGLNLIWESQSLGALCQGSVMDITSPSRAEFFASLPYAARANLPLLRYLLPAMFVMQFYMPGSRQHAAQLSLQENGRLHIEGRPNPIDLAKIGPMLKLFRSLGAITMKSLIVTVPMGHSVHYAGTLPMRDEPGPYECDARGKLHGCKHVHIADSAAFTGLPAKNMSFGMMAYAMRVGSDVASEVAA